MTKKQVLYRNNAEDDRDKGEKSIKNQEFPYFYVISIQLY